MWRWVSNIGFIMVHGLNESNIAPCRQCGGMIEIINICLCFCWKRVNPLLNFSEKLKKIDSCISHHSSALKCSRLLKFTPKEDRCTHIAYSQYHSYWWLSDPRSLDISSHGIDYIPREHSGCSTKRVNKTCWFYFQFLRYFVIWENIKNIFAFWPYLHIWMRFKVKKMQALICVKACHWPLGDLNENLYNFND